MKSTQTKGVQPNVNAEQYSHMPVLTPPIEEQKKIVLNLSKMDVLIQKTVQIIEQSQRLKKGLMQKLLNKKMQSNAVLGDLIDIRHGYAFKGQFFTNKPTKNILLTPGNFSISGGFKDDKITYYNGPVSEEFILADGDMIITMTDLSKMGDTLGYPAIVPSFRSCKYLHNQRLGRVVIKDSKRLSKLFLYYILSSNSYRQKILSSATGTTVRHTSPNRIKSFRFYLPPIVQQQRIAMTLTLSLVSDQIENEKRLKSRLLVLKTGLMQNFLTGKIRIKV